MAIGPILLSTVEGAFVSILIWLAPIASSTIPMWYFFNSWVDLKLFAMAYEFVPRIYGPFFGLVFVVVNIVFAALMGLSVWMLRGDHTFDQKIAPLIVNYIIMLPWATWSWPLIYNMSHLLTSGGIVAASLGTIVWAILCWIFGPWYCGLTATLALGVNAVIFFIWAVPEAVTIQQMLAKGSVFERMNNNHARWEGSTYDFDTKRTFRQSGIGYSKLSKTDSAVNCSRPLKVATASL